MREFPGLFRFGQKVTSVYEPKVGRIPIRLLSPRQPDDLWPAKAYVGAAPVLREPTHRPQVGEVEDAGHYVQVDQPQIAADAVHRVLSQVE